MPEAYLGVCVNGENFSKTVTHTSQLKITCSKLTITAEQCVKSVQFNLIGVVLLFLLLNLNIFHTFF